ncbi:MAG: CPBP family intramembrane metalloprotease [Clostridia bacterium]|nr:CPBP family intramembrane metalloprotease [Clostridia bacterium]
MNYQQNNSVPPQMAEFWTEYAAKQQISKTAWSIAVPGYVFFLVTNFLGFLLLYIGRAIGFDEQQIVTFASDPAANKILEVVLSFILMTVPFIISAKIAGYRISTSAGFNKPKTGTVFPHLLFGVGFCAFANIAVSLAGEFFEEFGIQDSATRSVAPEGLFGFLLTLIATVIVPALLEEFAFRGIVLGLLRPYGDAFAIIASSIVFGIFHGNFTQIPFAFLVGIALGFIRVKSGSIIIPMAVHAINNFIAVMSNNSDWLPNEFKNLFYTVYILFVLVAAVLGIMLLKNKGEFSFPKVERSISAGKTYRYFFLSPAFILLVILFAGRAIWYLL